MTLGAAVSGFLTPALAGVVDGEVVTYGIADSGGSEVGRGTYTAAGPTLSRDVVLASTDGGAAITLSGDAQVYFTIAGEDIQPMLAATGLWLAKGAGAL